MAKKVGELIKEARTAAKLTQAQLAEQVTGVTAADIGKAERGEKELTQAALKQIAKATGVTQASLLNAAAGKAAASAGKTASTGKTAAAGKTAAKKPAAGKTASTAKKTGAAKSSMQLTAAEKKLVELYRKADADTKKEVMKLLKGTGDDASELLTSLLSNAMSMFGKRSMPGEEGGEEGEEQEGGLVLKEE
ncbi:MAG: helix-turn-helix transcriptional regulator [Stomatobaculum sp.]|nr:helix-turn-helix transcriptional regulator [Stomatobaculum sp.]